MPTERYSRQSPLPGHRSERASAGYSIARLIIGCGALGSLQAEALARAGVGHLRIIDRDFVEASNLQRQTMFTEVDAAERT